MPLNNGLELDKAPSSEQISRQPIPVGCLPGQMAHYTRPHAIASELARQGVLVSLQGSAQDWQQFNTAMRQNAPPRLSFVDDNTHHYNPRELIQSDTVPQIYVDNVVAIAEGLLSAKPPVVISDHDVPLNIAAKIVGIPLVTITNTSNVASSSPSYIAQADAWTTTKIARYLGRLEPKQQEWYIRAYEQIHGVPFTRKLPSLFDIMERGELTLLADNPDFVLNNVPPRFDISDQMPVPYAFIGSIQPDDAILQLERTDSQQAAIDQMIEARHRGQKVIYGSFGTYWRPDLFDSLIGVAQKRPDLYFAILVRNKHINIPTLQNFLKLDFGDIPSFAAHADVLACQGGSGTIYSMSTTAQGGILSLTQNYDQVYNAGLSVHHGLGETMPIEEITEQRLTDKIDQLIRNQSYYAANIKRLGASVQLNGAQQAAQLIRSTFLI